MHENIKHYDSSLEFNINMYDRLPYNRDEQICGSDKVAISSGNVVKYYTIKEESPYVIGNQDENTKVLLKKKGEEILRKIQKEHEEYVSEAIEEALNNGEGALSNSEE